MTDTVYQIDNIGLGWPFSITRFQRTKCKYVYKSDIQIGNTVDKMGDI